MATKLTASTPDGEVVASWETDAAGKHTPTDQELTAAGQMFDPPLTDVDLPKVKAPSFKRPEGTSDFEWDLLRLSKSPDMVAGIVAVLAGDREPSQEEAALMLDVTKAAEMSALRQIRKLQTSLAPKIAELRARYHEHMSASAHLFTKATSV